MRFNINDFNDSFAELNALKALRNNEIVEVDGKTTAIKLTELFGIFIKDLRKNLRFFKVKGIKTQWINNELWFYFLNDLKVAGGLASCNCRAFNTNINSYNNYFQGRLTLKVLSDNQFRVVNF
jgi:hypothetical protein